MSKKEFEEQNNRWIKKCWNKIKFVTIQNEEWFVFIDAYFGNNLPSFFKSIIISAKWCVVVVVVYFVVVVEVFLQQQQQI